ncbi:MAG: efflux RND transporter periplasmic adaptor subunit [Alphaproteobacteria bacterium]|nr:efflux RND transporter periplasmic adaptor subunit [Alphaproteobacteria bacterium]
MIGRSVFAALALLASLAAVSVPALAQKAPLPVVTAPVVVEPIYDPVEALGTTKANERAAVTANVTEKIQEVRFEDGQAVEAGDVLVILNSEEERASLRAARAVFAERQSAWERAKTLGDRQFTATATIEEREALMEEAAANVSVAEARLADRTIRAPFDGVVGFREVSVGDLVEPGDVITQLTDLSVLKLDFTVAAVYLAALRPGLDIEARTAAFAQQPFFGTVRTLSTSIDPVTRTIVGRAIVPNPDGLLRPGMLMTVSLRLNPRNALMVPEEAVIPLGRSAFVFAVEEGAPPVARRTQVEVGQRFGGKVEILSGLSEGDRVITRGTIRVKDGQAIEIKEAGENGIGTAAPLGAEG